MLSKKRPNRCLKLWTYLYKNPVLLVVRSDRFDSDENGVFLGILLVRRCTEFEQAMVDVTSCSPPTGFLDGCMRSVTSLSNISDKTI